MTPVEVLQGGYDMEVSPSSERATAIGGDNDKQPVRDGIGVDGQRKHQRIYRCVQGCQPV